MNSFLAEQLNLVKIAKIPPIGNQNSIVIPKVTQVETLELKLNHNYIVQFADYIVKPPANFNLHVQWNDNNVPLYSYVKCTVIAEMGKMVKIDSVAINMKDFSSMGYYWTGWIPKKSITIIREI